MKQVIIFIAPPGAGKGTQAELLAEKFGFYNLESTKMLLDKLFSKEMADDPEAIKARKQYSTGELLDPMFVAKICMKTMKELYSQGESIIFSGNFRTLPEVQQELPLAEQLYGKDNVKIINITLSEVESVKRNSNRRICQANRHPIPNFPEYQNMTICPQDGSPLIKRSGIEALDQPEMIKKRYQVYKKETEPVLDYFREKGYKVIEINGEQPIEKVTDDILKYF